MIFLSNASFDSFHLFRCSLPILTFVYYQVYNVRQQFINEYQNTKLYIHKNILSYLNNAHKSQGLINAYARLPEWSKGLDLRSGIFVCVGSNPTAGTHFTFVSKHTNAV